MPAKQKLKAKQLNSLPDGFYPDGDGLYLHVKGNARSWVLRYQFNKKTHKTGLGSLRFVTLAEAREKVFKIKKELANGITPIELKHQEKKKIDIEISVRRFNDHYAEAIENAKRVRKWTSYRQSMRWYKTIERYALPVIGNIEISKINRDHVLTILSPIWDNKTETAAKLQRMLSAVFDYFISRGWIGENPARWKSGLDQFLPSPGKVQIVTNHPALNWKKVPEVVKNLLSGNMTQYEDLTMRFATIFGIVTASRIQEFVEAKWDEIDFENYIWIMPVERRKDRKPYPHRVPLPSQIVSLLLELRENHRGDYIFCPPDKKGHISKESPIRYLRLAADDEIITMHGCRSTFRDWCAENGIDKVLAEKALSHATGNEVEQAYQRSDLLEQRRPIMQKWADHCFSSTTY